jgi:hypothetical protein
MKWYLILCLTVGSVVWADTLELISGEVLEGEILTENARELEFEISRTRSRSFRNVLIVSHDLVKRLSRSTPKPKILAEITESTRLNNEPPQEVDVTYSLEKLKDLLRMNEGLMENGQYDDAIALYKSVVDDAYEASKVESNLVARMELTEVQERGYKFWIVALDGKQDSMKEKERRLETIVENEVDVAEDNLDKARDLARQNSRSNDRTVVKLGSGRTRSPVATGGQSDKTLQLIYDQAVAKKSQFDAWAKTNAAEIKNLEAEAALLKEKNKQISRELYTLKRQVKDHEKIRR